MGLTLRSQRACVSLYRGGPLPEGARRYWVLTGPGAVEELCHLIGAAFACGDTSELEAVLRDDVGLGYAAPGTAMCVMAWPEGERAAGRRAA